MLILIAFGASVLGYPMDSPPKVPRFFDWWKFGQSTLNLILPSRD
jgi:hypothetical protein